MQHDAAPVELEGSEQSEEVSVAALGRALEGARKRRELAREQIEKLERDAALAAEEERLLGNLIAVRRGEMERADVALAPGEEGRLQIGGTPTEQDVKSSHPVVDEVMSMLERERRPVHISEIMRMLRQRQIRLPGSGKQANVISHLRRDARISRPSRGLYALTAWALVDEEPKLTVRRRRRKKAVSRVKESKASGGR